jgi:diaminopimelate decarboxylase
LAAYPKPQTQITFPAFAPSYPNPFTAPTRPALPKGFAVEDDRLIYRGLDVQALLEQPLLVDGQVVTPSAPLYLRRLTALRDNYYQLYRWFNAAKTTLAYPGSLMVAFASKANPSQPVAQTLMQAGAAYECSSAFDVDIVRGAAANGWLETERPILANGFKIPRYAQKLFQLRRDGFTHILPVLDDAEEVETFINSGLQFEVGLRARTNSDGNNRFGFGEAEIQAVAAQLMASGNLTLTTYHAMQTVSAGRGIHYQRALVDSLRRYAALKRAVPSLHRYNFGGGLPARYSLRWTFRIGLTKPCAPSSKSVLKKAYPRPT